MNIPIPKCDRMLNHHCRRNPELHEELQIQAAVAAGDVCTVRRMLEQGYSPKIRDANGWTLLHFSAAKGKERCVRVFLEHGGQKLVSCLLLGWWVVGGGGTRGMKWGERERGELHAAKAARGIEPTNQLCGPVLVP